MKILYDRRTFFGMLITKEIFKKGITQQEFANQVGITPTQVSRLLNGLSEPKPKTLKNISRCLGLDMNVLVEALFKK